jgi:hypothetical protein
MCVWYTIGYRWTLQGNQLGVWKDNGFMLNWWFAPINMITAFLSAYFVLRAFFFTDQSFTQNMMYIATFIFLRNCYYAVEDLVDYMSKPSKEQFWFVVIDLVMAAFSALWILKCKAQ